MFRIVKCSDEVSLNMNQQDMLKYLHMLDKKLADNEMTCEIEMFGGAVMCLGLNARESTHDIDAVFQPKAEVRDLIHEIALENNIPYDWMNDGVKGFVSDNNTVIRYDDSTFSNLTVFMATPEYMLAMKCLSARLSYENSTEINDIKFLVTYLNLNSPEDVFDIISRYYPNNLIKPKTQYLIEELFQHE